MALHQINWLQIVTLETSHRCPRLSDMLCCITNINVALQRNKYFYTVTCMSDYSQGLGFGNQIYWPQLQLTTTVHGSTQPTIHYGSQLSSPILWVPELYTCFSHNSQLLLSQENSLQTPSLYITQEASSQLKLVQVKVMLQPVFSQSWVRHLSGAHYQISYYCQTVPGLLRWGERVCRSQLLLVLTSTVILRSMSTGLTTVFYCLISKTPPTWRTKSPYLYPPGT
jgi:hypothetical protein